MDSESKSISDFWTNLRHHLEDQLLNIQKEEAFPVAMAARSLHAASYALKDLLAKMGNHSFIEGEEVFYYKSIKPYFLSQVLFFTKIHKIESCRSPEHLANLSRYYMDELARTTAIFEQHQFIYNYLQSEATYLDDRLFFRQDGSSVIAISGTNPLTDGAFQVSYDHVIADLLAADLIGKYLIERLEFLQSPGLASGSLPKLTWTAPKAHGIELGYALYAAGVFNNGKAQLKDIMECLEIAFHIKWGNYPRTWQEILYRKGGRTVFQDDMKNKYLLYIQRIEDKDFG